MIHTLVIAADAKSRAHPPSLAPTFVTLCSKTSLTAPHAAVGENAPMVSATDPQLVAKLQAGSTRIRHSSSDFLQGLAVS
jgi:hypothetical protein